MERTFAVPKVGRPSGSLVPLLLFLTGLGAVLAAIAGDSLTGGVNAGIGPNQLAVGWGGVVLIAGGLWFTSEKGKLAGGWLVSPLAAVSVGMISNLVVVIGIPAWWAKIFLLCSTGMGVFALRVQSGEEPFGWVKLARVSVLAVQLFVLMLVIQQFHVSDPVFSHNLIPLAFSGFLVHYILPPRYRLTFFLAISFTGFVGILGISNGLLLVIAGTALIGICHLPVRHSVRAAVLLCTGVILSFFRVGWVELSWAEAIWPILGSMFMFRLFIYLYDLKHRKQPLNRFTLSYFFLLPNIVFPLFPVVDYRTFNRNYYNIDEDQIHLRGIRWIFWGVVHLLLYKLVNFHLVISPEEVYNSADLVRYIVPHCFLLLRVSGQFHLAVGILMLFGFNLPRTMRRYFLASSFTDFWRRANIYWKDFMLKVFYYPVYMKLRRFEGVGRLMIATGVVFLITWFFHAYQWFWLRGTILFSATDIVFWSLFGLLVLGNSLYENRFGRRRSLGNQDPSPAALFSVSIRIVLTFSVIAVLWSIWISQSLSEWMSLWKVIDEPLRGPEDLLFVGGLLLALVAAAFWENSRRESGVAGRVFLRSAATYSVPMVCLLTLSHVSIGPALGGRAESVISDLKSSQLSQRQAAVVLRGYYENLTNVNLFNSELWKVYSGKPADWPLIQDTKAARLTGDFMSLELNPSQSLIFHGARFSTNRWGMRGRDCLKSRADGTYRIALLGPSFVMGSGVADDEVFAVLLEDRLNKYEGQSTFGRVEVLNFGTSGHSALQELVILERRAVSFEPNLVVYVAHQFEDEILIRNLANAIVKGVELPYDYLSEIARKAEIRQGDSSVEAERKLAVHGIEILSWAYQRIAAVCRQKNVLPVWVFLPALESPSPEETVTRLRQLAIDAGLVTIDLSGIFRGLDLQTLTVASWDMHPNARGHRLISDQLFVALRENGIPPQGSFKSNSDVSEPDDKTLR